MARSPTTRSPATGTPATPSFTAGRDGPVSATVTVGGRALPDAVELKRLEIRHALDDISQARIALGADGQRILKEAARRAYTPGTEIRIAAGYGGTETDVFSGMITALSLEAGEETLFILDARGVTERLRTAPRTVQKRDCRDSDVMEQIFSEAGLSADIEATEGVRNHVSTGLTPWEDLLRLAHRNGMVIASHAAPLRIAPPALDADPALTLSLGETIIALNTRLDATTTLTSAAYRIWDDETQGVVTGLADTSEEPRFGGLSAQALTSGTKAPKRATEALGTPTGSAALKVFAEARLRRSEAAALTGQCSFEGSAALAPGDTLEIKETGRMFGGHAYVSAVAHEIAAGAWTTTATLGLPDRPSAAQGPSLTGLTGLHLGKVRALGADPEGRQRILVSLPLLAEAGDTEIWARTTHPYASDAAGFAFLPEIGDEVVVAFTQGDPQGPVVLGALHNAQSPRPEAVTPAQDANPVKTITTRSKLAVTFDDATETLSLTTPGGLALTLNDQANEITLALSNGPALTLDTGGIKITGKDIAIEASGALDLSGTQTLRAQGGSVDVSADATATVHGAAKATLESGGQTVVKGAMVQIN